MIQPEPLLAPDGQDVLLLGAVTPKGRRTRSRIVAAGRTVLEEQGYFAGSTSDVAARAGIALGTFYRYFKNKEQLFLEILASLVEEMRTAAGSAWGDEPQ
jgi:AcrR family transcriptional regulator